MLEIEILARVIRSAMLNKKSGWTSYDWGIWQPHNLNILYANFIVLHIYKPISYQPITPTTFTDPPINLFPK